jgi:hypothetical protein
MIREHIRSWSCRYYVERHYAGNQQRHVGDYSVDVMSSHDSEVEGWATVDRLNATEEGCWHVLVKVERWEVELER